MFCFHKYGEIKDRYQYCSKCGKAKPVKCAHQWEDTHSQEAVITNGIRFYMRCKHCGEHKASGYN